MTKYLRWLVVLVAPLVLSSCLLVPAKFVSTLDIRADRTFTFTYVGEVMLLKDKKPSLDGEGEEGKDGTNQSFDEQGAEPRMTPIAVKKQGKSAATVDNYGDRPEEAAQIKQLAETLRAEYGYRSVRYVGNRKLAIDYRISGKLDHAFIFPFNPDGEIILPFVAIELRGKDRLRVKAPGFANEQSSSTAMGGMGGMTGMGGDNAGSVLDGSFTLTTNGELISQNQEDGAQSMPDGSKKVVWTANPSSRVAPMAVLRVAPLP